MARGEGHRPTRAQPALQLPAKGAAALDEQRPLDGLVRHPQHRILKGRPAATSPRSAGVTIAGSAWPPPPPAAAAPGPAWRLAAAPAGLEHERAHRRPALTQFAGHQAQRRTLSPARPELVLLLRRESPGPHPSPPPPTHPSLRKRCNHPLRPRRKAPTGTGQTYRLVLARAAGRHVKRRRHHGRMSATAKTFAYAARP